MASTCHKIGKSAQLGQEGVQGTKLGQGNEIYLMCMNIRPNRSQGLVGCRLTELGTVCQTQRSMIKSMNIVKSMESF